MCIVAFQSVLVSCSRRCYVVCPFASADAKLPGASFADFTQLQNGQHAWNADAKFSEASNSAFEAIRQLQVRQQALRDQECQLMTLVTPESYRAFLQRQLPRTSVPD